MRSAAIATAIALAATGAQADEGVVFENAIDPAEISSAAPATTGDAMFAAWTATRTALETAELAGASESELVARRAAVEAAGAAYEATLVAANIVLMADAGVEPMDSETAALFDVLLAE